VKGAYIVADEANKIFKKQGLKGNIVFDDECERGGREKRKPRV
jgi:hypothetical protein